MKAKRNIVTLITATLTLASATSAVADEKYSFPSPNGALVAASTPHFVPVQAEPQAHLTADVGASSPAAATMTLSTSKAPPMPIVGQTFMDRYGARSKSGDAYSYRFLTHALGSQSFANYAADYYRLFTPGHAVTTWTDRMYGLVELGYGGAIDSWTAGTYYLGKVRGPARRGESAPDLSVMPTFRAHPELEEKPVFAVE